MCPHIVVTVEDLKAVHDLLGTGPSPYVQEVGWLSSIQLDYVHGGHCQTCSVHYTQTTLNMIGLDYRSIIPTTMSAGNVLQSLCILNWWPTIINLWKHIGRKTRQPVI